MKVESSFLEAGFSSTLHSLFSQLGCCFLDLAKNAWGMIVAVRVFADLRNFHQAPCIVFIDEIDAIGRQRGATSPVSSLQAWMLLQCQIMQELGWEVATTSVNRP